MPTIADLPNLGPKSAAMLARAGYRTPADIRRDGAALTFARVQQTTGDGRVSRVLLWALQGALMELHWQLVPDEIRGRLLAEVAAHQAALTETDDVERDVRATSDATEHDSRDAGDPRPSDESRARGDSVDGP